MTTAGVGRFTCVLFVLLAVGAGVAAPPSVPPDIARAPGRAEFPLDDGLLVRQKLVITLDGQGRVTRTVESALKNFGQWANAHGYFDPSLSWNDARAELIVEEARTYTTDGRVVEAKANSLVPNTAPALETATPYAFLRQLTVAQVGIEDDSTTVLKFSVRDRRPSGVPLWGAVELAGSFPVLDQLVAIEVPVGVVLNWKTIDCAATPQVTTAGGLVRTEFRRTKVPGVNMAELGAEKYGLCRLVYSAARDWADVRAFLERSIEPASAADDTVRAKAQDIVKDGVLDGERIARLHSFVVDGVQTIRWPLEAFDFAARPAGKVLESSVGHSLDKAVLLASLLRSLGYTARVALVGAAPGAPLEVPSPVLFEAAWVVVADGPHTVWLDPTATLDKRNESHIAGRAALILDGGATAPVILPALDSASNRAALRADIKLEDAGGELRVSGEIDVDLSGLYNPLRALDRSRDRVGAVAAAAAASFGGAKARETTVGWKSAQLTALRVKLGDGAIVLPRDGRPVELVVPRVPGALSGDALHLHRERRTLPLVTPGPAEERISVSVQLPDSVELAAAPAEQKLDFGVGSLVREVKRDGRRLMLTTTFTLKTAIVRPEQYGELRQLFAALESDNARTILLAPKP